MQARWLALCGWLLGGLAQAAETIRYCDYPVYPPISWSDGQQVRGLAPELVKLEKANKNFSAPIKLEKVLNCLGKYNLQFDAPDVKLEKKSITPSIIISQSYV